MQKHDPETCGKCIFVPDRKSIKLFYTESGHRKKAKKCPLNIGRFTLPEWVSCNSFYMFRCISCDNYSVDYPHGYTSDWFSRGLLYLKCDTCGSIRPLRDIAIYKDEDLDPPLTFWQELKELFSAAKRSKQERNHNHDS